MRVTYSAAHQVAKSASGNKPAIVIVIWNEAGANREGHWVLYWGFPLPLSSLVIR